LKGVIEDDSFFGIIYTLDTKKDWPELITLQEKKDGKDGTAEDDWYNEDCWVKPIPGLCGVTANGIKYGVNGDGAQIPGYMSKIEDVRDKCRVAKEIVAAQNNFLTKRMNVWTQQHSRWIDLQLWDANFIRGVYSDG
jgi:phage terminase large subunit-like protein